MSETDQLIDHAAALQRDIDRLSRELLTLALGLIALTVACALMGWELWSE